ncbi:MAG TPA: outer membrane protein assembly factor BamD [Terriglobia bacterium]|nr:outer membrane protein assembly factor BamD [Terriglobia bacterium]
MNFKNSSDDTLPKRPLLILLVLILGAVFFPGCLFHRHHNDGLAVAPGEQPDKILLQKSQKELQHGRYTTGRLLLQSLINTYPDSEYLSQAKLTIANSYFKQGGISGLTEAEAEYKDFITFFPTAPEAPMAEYRAGLCHFRLMGKADRDQTEAHEAEREFKEFLVKFPTNPLMPDVKNRLREVQEVLAQGDYGVAMFYYRRGDYPAAQSRLKEVVDNYPSFSQGDHAFWYIAQALTHMKKQREAVPYYDRLVMEFPLSPLVPDAKEQLADLHKPIPQPTKAMMARAEADASHHHHRNVILQALGAFSGAPDFSETLHGPVLLGSANQIEVKIAKLNGTLKPPAANSTASASATSAGEGQNSISIQTSSLASLNSGKNLDPAPSDSSSSSTATKSDSNKNSKDQQNLASQNGNSPSSEHPEKKKGMFHFFKKIIP